MCGRSATATPWVGAHDTYISTGWISLLWESPSTVAGRALTSVRPSLFVKPIFVIIVNRKRTASGTCNQAGNEQATGNERHPEPATRPETNKPQETNGIRNLQPGRRTDKPEEPYKPQITNGRAGRTAQAETLNVYERPGPTANILHQWGGEPFPLAVRNQSLGWYLYIGGPSRIQRASTIMSTAPEQYKPVRHFVGTR